MNHAPTLPSTPTEVRDLMALRERINKRLPDGWTVNVAEDTDVNGQQFIAVYPQGFEIDRHTGEFRAPGVTLDPDHTVYTQVTLNAITIPDVYIDGWDLRPLIANNADEILFGGMTTAAFTPIDSDVLSVEDLWTEVEFDATFEVEVTLNDLGIMGDERFNDADEARDAVNDMLAQYVADEFGCDVTDVSVDLTEEQIGL